MASTNRNPDINVGLLKTLASDPYHFGFYEALRQLECVYSDRPRLGKSMSPTDDAVRLGQTPSLRFAPSTLASYRIHAKNPPLLSVYFFGQFGPNGPLPLHLTEYARNRERNAKDSTLTEFMDLFHHRLLSLFYRVWADKEPTVHFDRPEQDRFGCYVASLQGLGLPSLRNRDAMPDLTKLHYTGHLASHTRHAEGLASIIAGFFNLQVKIVEFVGEWLVIPEESFCYLDRDETTGQLGQSAVLGTRSWQCQQKFRIRLGPVKLNDYEGLLPDGDSLKRLRDIVWNYIGFELEWDLNLVLDKQEVPHVQLGGDGRLGWTSWLYSQNRNFDADDLNMSGEVMTTIEKEKK